MQVTYSGMGTVLASRSAGYFIGNLLGSIFQTIVKNHSEALLFVAFILPSIGKKTLDYRKKNIFSSSLLNLVISATPYVTSLIVMCVLAFMQGLSKAFTDLGKLQVFFGHYQL